MNRWPNFCPFCGTHARSGGAGQSPDRHDQHARRAQFTPAGVAAPDQHAARRVADSLALDADVVQQVIVEALQRLDGLALVVNIDHPLHDAGESVPDAGEASFIVLFVDGGTVRKRVNLLH